jgi:hypothetical protein
MEYVIPCSFSFCRSFSLVTAHAHAPMCRMHRTSIKATCASMRCPTPNEWPHKLSCATPHPTPNEWLHELHRLPCAACILSQTSGAHAPMRCLAERTGVGPAWVQLHAPLLFFFLVVRHRLQDLVQMQGSIIEVFPHLPSFAFRLIQNKLYMYVSYTSA